MKNLFALQICLFLIGCDGMSSQNAIPQINMGEAYQEKELFLQDVAEIDYIALETTDENLFDSSGTITEISDQGIVGVDQYYNKVCFFTHDGKATGTLSKRGEGPGEYLHLDAAWIDRAHNEIFVSDRTIQRLYVYDLNGTFKRVIAFNPSLCQNDIADYDNGHFISFKDYPLNKELNKSVAPYQPAVLVSKEDGSIVDSLSYFKDFIASITLVQVFIIFKFWFKSKVYATSDACTYTCIR